MTQEISAHQGPTSLTAQEAEKFVLRNAIRLRLREMNSETPLLGIAEQLIKQDCIQSTQMLTQVLDNPLIFETDFLRKLARAIQADEIPPLGD